MKREDLAELLARAMEFMEAPESFSDSDRKDLHEEFTEMLAELAKDRQSGSGTYKITTNVRYDDKTKDRARVLFGDVVALSAEIDDDSDGCGEGYGCGYNGGSGFGHGSSYGDGQGSGHGYGYGYGHGYSSVYGYGSGSGDGYGLGYGSVYGDGDGYGEEIS